MRVVCCFICVVLLCGFAHRDPTDKSSRFFRVAADNALLNAEEGRLASVKGSAALVRKYGEFLAASETKMLDDMKPVAERLGFELPLQINQENKEFWAQLNSKSGRDFDELFLSMMKQQQKNDVRLFRSAIKEDAPEVSSFAAKYLPVVRRHLAALKAVRHGKDFKD